MRWLVIRHCIWVFTVLQSKRCTFTVCIYCMFVYVCILLYNNYLSFVNNLAHLWIRHTFIWNKQNVLHVTREAQANAMWVHWTTIIMPMIDDKCTIYGCTWYISQTALMAANTVSLI